MKTAHGFDLNKTLITTPYLDFVRKVDADICERWLRAQEDPTVSDQAAVDRFEEIVEYGFTSREMEVYATKNAVEAVRALQKQGQRIFAYSTCTAKATEAVRKFWFYRN